MSPSAAECPVAIVGMSVLLPGAPDLATYWRNLVGAVDAISEVPEGRWDESFYSTVEGGPDRIYCRRGGFVDAEIDVTRFGIMPNSVPGTEPDQLIALRVAASAIADAGGDHRLPSDRQRVGVVLGRGGYLTPGLVRLDQRVRTANQLVRTLGELLPELGADQLSRVRAAFTDTLGPHSPESAIGLVPNLAASRVANRLDLRGPAYTVDAACASSLVAVDQAVRELATGRCDVVLAGGVHHCHDITLWSVFAQLRALSPSQRIRPLHRDADGILIGEGTGVVVLKRLRDAERAGDRIYAVIRGTGVASDGRTASLVNPDPGGQVRAVRQAWQAAGLDPTEAGAIGLLEAHGTATPAGDAAELATIAEVFGPATSEVDRAVIGSVKSMIGHTMPAAGVASLVKAALAVYHGVLPPTLHCDDPNPALAETRFRPLDAAAPWEPVAGQPVRRAGVNAFGFGGINAHVVLEQARTSVSAAPVTSVNEPERVLRLAEDNPARLADLLAADDTEVLAAGLSEYANPAGRSRLAIVDPTAKRLALARRAVGKGRSWRGRNDVWFAPTPLLGTGGGRLAFVFPGLEAEFAPRVDDVARHFGLPWSTPESSVGDLGRHGAAVFQLGRLLAGALREMGIVPDAVAGHSIGEWTAMACGGIHDAKEVDEFLATFDPDAVRVPGLTFAVLGAPAATVLAAIAEYPDVVLSHDNAPHQSMICGPADQVDNVVVALRRNNVLGQVLPFQSGFHTPMLEPYLGPIVAIADRYRLRPPIVPVWSATTASEFPADAVEVRRLFVRHLLEPVRFRPMIEAMYAAGFRAFIQTGFGQLGSLIADILSDKEHLAVPSVSAHRDGLAQLRRVSAALWADGVPASASRRPKSAQRSGRPVQLDLGGCLVSLDPLVRKELSARIANPPAASMAGESVLDSLGSRHPLAAELSALLRETAHSAAAVLTAGTGYGRTPSTGEPPANREFRTELRVSIEDMPYLLDHCFFQQRPDWPDDVDRWPVVPATTLIGHMMEFAERAAPGRRAVAVHDVRLNRWIAAIPAIDVPVTVLPAGPDRVAVSLGDYSRATVELAPDYRSDPPKPWDVPPDERAPDMVAAALYTERWMFHGPLFQGVSELTGIGDTHARGVLTTPPAPGALLDNVGQLLGYWIMRTHSHRSTVFPVQMKHIRFFGTHPAVGSRLGCHVRITSLTDTLIEADMQLTENGRVWAEFHGWQDRRFDSTPETRKMDRFPQHNTLATVQTGGWVLVHERWPDLASRDLFMRIYLGGAERERYESHPPRGRRQWLLGRIAAKDAVRRWLWDHDQSAAVGPVFPAEVEVHEDDAGRTVVSGVHGRRLPDLTVSIGHCGETGVAIVAPAHQKVGIAVRELTESDDRVDAEVSAESERALLATLCRSAGTTSLWRDRFCAAREAVAKATGDADGTVVGEAEAGALVVAGGGREYLVRWREVANPPELPARRYVVAWCVEEGERL
jgi:3-oxoacyl-(acyl-carrier-protein) synthase/malonyl CoA-acyl carrier protein transacylase